MTNSFEQTPSQSEVPLNLNDLFDPEFEKQMQRVDSDEDFSRKMDLLGKYEESWTKMRQDSTRQTAEEVAEYDRRDNSVEGMMEEEKNNFRGIMIDGARKRMDDLMDKWDRILELKAMLFDAREEVTGEK